MGRECIGTHFRFFLPEPARISECPICQSSSILATRHCRAGGVVTSSTPDCHRVRREKAVGVCVYCNNKNWHRLSDGRRSSDLAKVIAHWRVIQCCSGYSRSASRRLQCALESYRHRYFGHRSLVDSPAAGGLDNDRGAVCKKRAAPSNLY